MFIEYCATKLHLFSVIIQVDVRSPSLPTQHQHPPPHLRYSKKRTWRIKWRQCENNKCLWQHIIYWMLWKKYVKNLKKNERNIQCLRRALNLELISLKRQGSRYKTWNEFNIQRQNIESILYNPPPPPPPPPKPKKKQHKKKIIIFFFFFFIFLFLN